MQCSQSIEQVRCAFFEHWWFMIFFLSQMWRPSRLLSGTLVGQPTLNYAWIYTCTTIQKRKEVFPIQAARSIKVILSIYTLQLCDNWFKSTFAHTLQTSFYWLHLLPAEVWFPLAHAHTLCNTSWRAKIHFFLLLIYFIPLFRFWTEKETLKNLSSWKEWVLLAQCLEKAGTSRLCHDFIVT